VNRLAPCLLAILLGGCACRPSVSAVSGCPDGYHCPLADDVDGSQIKLNREVSP